MRLELDQLKRVLAVIPGNVYWKDRSGAYLGCNLQQCQLVGLLNVEDIIGKTDYDLYDRAVADCVWQDDQKIMETQETRVFEEVGVNAQGESAIYLTKKMPLFGLDKKVEGIIGVSIDISAQKAAEAREKLAMVHEAEVEGHLQAEREMRQSIMVLTGSIVHDLRTPLLSFGMGLRSLNQVVPVLLDAYTQTNLQEILAPPDILKTLEDLGYVAKQLESFIDHTLNTLTKSTLRAFAPEDLIPCSLNKCVMHTLSHYPFVQSERDWVRWQQPTEDLHVMGNQLLLIRILYHLIKNALYQIHQNHRGQIFISAERTAGSILLRFKDTAGGVEPTVQARLFEGYKTTKLDGTGIGLAYCQRVMQSFGGEITVDSIYGDFIEFVLCFPLRPAT